MSRVLVDEKVIAELIHRPADMVTVLAQLADLLRTTREAAVPFIPIDPVHEAKLRTAVRSAPVAPGLKEAAASLVGRLFQRTAAPTSGAATVVGLAAQRSPAWHVALATSVGAGWRAPRLTYALAHKTDWPQVAEVDVIPPAGATTSRVLTAVERARDHDFFLPDVDPWDLRLAYSQTTNLSLRAQLPRPPPLLECPVERLAAEVARLHQEGWDPKLNGRFYFLPAVGWDPLAKAPAKSDWRSWKFFEWISAGGYRGPVDSEGRIWSFHQGPAGTSGERHWDVQARGHPVYGVKADISQDGRFVRAPVGGWS